MAAAATRRLALEEHFLAAIERLRALPALA
jgi:hypothetical protein